MPIDNQYAAHTFSGEGRFRRGAYFPVERDGNSFVPSLNANTYFPSFVTGGGGGTIYNFSAGGSFNFSGAVTRNFVKTFPTAGNVIFSGSSILQLLRVFNLTAAGSILFSGITNLIKTKIFSSSGLITFSGTAPFSKTKVFSAAGILLFSGTSRLARIKILNASGNIIFSSPAVNLSKAKTLSAGGQILFFGGMLGGLFTRIRTYQTSGNVTFNGSAALSFSSSGPADPSDNHLLLLGVGKV
ncbi:MAG: hypothetical protein ACRDBG_00185 [Waterburya sp.]